MMPILEARRVNKSFGGVRAVDDVSLSVEAHKLVSLIGPNGAGKTTLFNLLAGLLGVDDGQVWFDGTRIDGRGPHWIARQGLVRTFQNIRMFPGLTVFESLIAAQHTQSSANSLLSLFALGRHRSEWRSMAGRAEATMELLRIEQHADIVAEELPLLEQRKVEIGRAVLAEPRVLLLDEPTAGATKPESEELKTVIRGLLDEGITILLIEHSMRVVMSISDLVHVLSFGKLIASGTPEEISANKEVQNIYLGTGKS